MGAIDELIAMGFAPARVRTAIASCGDDIEAALQWLVDHTEESEEPAAAAEPGASSGAEASLFSMGFAPSRVRAAIDACGADNLEAALQWLVEYGEKQPEPPAKVRRVGGGAPAARAAPVVAALEPLAPPPRKQPEAAASSSSPSMPLPTATGHTDQRSLKRLMKEYNALAALEKQGGCRKLHSYEAAPVDASDLYTWDLHLYDFETDQEIAGDLRARNMERLTLRMLFPADYPNSPPFVHMLRPRLREGTGYVLNGGGICMELLTPSEWSPATSISALVMSVRAMLICGQARLRTASPSAREPDYCVEDARKDFAHIVKVHKEHGWTTHRMFKDS